MRRFNGSTFGERLEQAIIKNRPDLCRLEVDHEKASAALGVSKSTFESYLYNRSKPRTENLPRVSREVRCKVEDLVPTE